MGKTISQNIGSILFFGLIATSISYCSYESYKKKKENKVHIEAYYAKERACKLDPTCQDSKAKELSKKEQRVAHSTTGKIYLYGKLCPDNCADFLAGYDWADIRGISKDMGCSEHLGLFKKGCLGYVEDRKYELSSDETEYHEPQNESDCQLGKYGDC